MSPLAIPIYDLLRSRVRRPDARVTYAELARELRDRAQAFEHNTHRSHELYMALGEIGAECAPTRAARATPITRACHRVTAANATPPGNATSTPCGKRSTRGGNEGPRNDGHY